MKVICVNTMLEESREYRIPLSLNRHFTLYKIYDFYITNDGNCKHLYNDNGDKIPVSINFPNGYDCFKLLNDIREEKIDKILS